MRGGKSPALVWDRKLLPGSPQRRERFQRVIQSPSTPTQTRARSSNHSLLTEVRAVRLGGLSLSVPWAARARSPGRAVPCSTAGTDKGCRGRGTTLPPSTPLAIRKAGNAVLKASISSPQEKADESGKLRHRHETRRQSQGGLSHCALVCVKNIKIRNVFKISKCPKHIQPRVSFLSQTPSPFSKSKNTVSFLGILPEVDQG